ncbi:galanin receptor type 1-like [Brevipalpus obovatus]|uniref:galanin receptor type 1-like n=1 Tax=Brevipalpus obovatus TaxID=246614 RepID=UPI003D9E5E59
MESSRRFFSSLDMMLPGNTSYVQYNAASNHGATGQPDTDTHILDFIESQYNHHESDVIAITLLYVFIFLVGLVGNCAIIYWHVDSRSPYYQRTASNPLVINLCLSDLMVILFCCPFVAYGKNTSIWKFGEFLCTVVHYLQGTAVTSTTLSLTALAFARYLLMQRSDLMSKRKFASLTSVFLLVVWSCSLLLPVPILLVRRLQNFDLLNYSFEFCLEFWTSVLHRKIFSIVTFVIVYLIPCCILIYCHAKVSIALYASGRQRSSNLRGSAHKKAFRVKTSTTMSSDSTTVDNLDILNDPTINIKKRLALNRRHLSRLLVGITVCFVFCWLPYNITSFYLDLTESEIAIKILPFTLLLGHAHSAVNPIVYWMLIRGERQKRMKVIELRSIMVQLSHNSMNERNKSREGTEHETERSNSAMDHSTVTGCAYYRYCVRY